MTTTVVHVNDPVGFDVYIGRAARRAKNPRARSDSPWRNPFPLKKDASPMERAECLAAFNRYLMGPTDDAAWMRGNVGLIRGKRLGCWCPDIGVQLTGEGRHICHGQLLATLADTYPPPPRVGMPVDEFAAAAGLDDEETVAWEAVRVAASAYLNLPAVHPMERSEICTAFHHIQARLLARPAMRLLQDGS